MGQAGSACRLDGGHLQLRGRRLDRLERFGFFEPVLRPAQDRALRLERFRSPGQLEPLLFSGRSLYLLPDGPAAEPGYDVHDQLRQYVQNILGTDAPRHHQRQTLPRVLVHHLQRNRRRAPPARHSRRRSGLQDASSRPRGCSGWCDTIILCCRCQGEKSGKAGNSDTQMPPSPRAESVTRPPREGGGTPGRAGQPRGRQPDRVPQGQDEGDRRAAPPTRSPAQSLYNATCRPDADVARRGSRGRILVIATREDVTILREVIQVLGGTR